MDGRDFGQTFIFPSLMFTMLLYSNAFLIINQNLSVGRQVISKIQSSQLK